MKKIQCVVTQNNGISYHRIINKLSYLNMGEDWKAEILWFGEDEWKIDGDILWYSKYLVTEPQFIEKIKAKGTKVVVDIDDDWELPVWHPSHKQWYASGRPQRVVDNIRIADIVICSTMKVQEKVRQYNKNTVVIPNAFPYGYDVYQPLEQEPRDKMTFIYAGGSTHYNDVKLLEGKFKRIGSDKWMKDNSLYLLAGYVPVHQKVAPFQNGPTLLKQVRSDWDKMASVFAQTGTYRILPSDELDTYVNYYDMADVSLIPLQNHPWNSYKSNLKILEACTKRIPVICSNTAPYSEMKDYPGIMWVDNNNWLDHIRFCIKNPDIVREMGEQLADKVWEDYNLIKWNEVLKQVFNSLVA